MTSEQISTEEQEQILQTIQMFEVIVQSNPDDAQSLEILKEAYWKLGRQSDALAVSRRLADTYMNLGQYSSAMLEYEGILQREPDSPEIVAMLGEVEAKLAQSSQAAAADKAAGIDVDFGSVVGSDPTLITTEATRKPQEEIFEPRITLDNDGNEPLAKFLIQHRLVPEDVVTASLERVQKTNKSVSGEALAASLIDEVVKSGSMEMDTLMCGILDRTKFAYVPLDYYDVDRQIVKMLPENLTLGRLIVPFDLISRTVMIAMANPFDALGKEAVQQLFDYHIQWHLASPGAISKILRETYRLDARD
jgi:Type II secretion system (T2SS), protein E, N-terminal domain